MLNEFNFLFNNSEVHVDFDNNGIAWFRAEEISNVLGYGRARDMVRRLPESEKARQVVATIGGAQEAYFINEYGLYRIIMRASSKIPAAEEFQNKVFYDILPCIRKYGAYIDANTRAQLEANPNLIHNINANIDNHEKKRMYHVIDKSRYPYNAYEDMRREIPMLREERDNAFNQLNWYLKRNSLRDFLLGDSDLSE